MGGPAGADIVNLSLGGPDAPGVDPLEAEVNKLSAQKGILFAIAAGNDGPESIGSPGSADAALTVAPSTRRTSSPTSPPPARAWATAPSSPT